MGSEESFSRNGLQAAAILAGAAAASLSCSGESAVEMWPLFWKLALVMSCDAVATGTHLNAGVHRTSKSVPARARNTTVNTTVSHGGAYPTINRN